MSTDSPYLHCLSLYYDTQINLKVETTMQHIQLTECCTCATGQEHKNEYNNVLTSNSVD